ncbi:Na/Pi cotransporter family protein, partial [Vibrio sp. 10N.222.49.C9]
GEFAAFALQIALVHLLFNVAATLFIFGIPFLRELPLKGADWISTMAIKNKSVVAGYLIAVFVVMPGAIIAMTA